MTTINILNRCLTLISLILALFGAFAAPGFVTRAARRRATAIYRVHPDDGDIPGT